MGASLLFLLVNVLCAVLSRRRRAQPWALLLVRVLVSDSLFVICALSLAACLCLVARRAPSTSIYLEAKVGPQALMPRCPWGSLGSGHQGTEEMGSLPSLRILCCHPCQGTSVCQAAAMGGAMVLLYASRACYNLAALALAPRSRLDAFDYDWYNVSDQVSVRHVCCSPAVASAPKLALPCHGATRVGLQAGTSSCCPTGGSGK